MDNMGVARMIAAEATIKGKRMAGQVAQDLVVDRVDEMGFVELTIQTLALAHCAAGLLSLAKILFDMISRPSPGVGQKFFPIFMTYLQQELDESGINVKISRVEEDTDDGKDLAGSPGVAGGPKGV